MKTKDASFIQSFKEYSLKIGDEKDRAFSAFKRRIYVDDLNAYLRNKIKGPVDIGIGSLDSKVIIVMNKKDKEHIAFYRDWMLQKGPKISDVYVTFLYKGDPKFIEDYKVILKKEAELFKDNCIIINHTNEIFEGYVKSVNDEMFVEMIALSKRDDLKEDERAKLATLKKFYWSSVRELLNYRLF